MDLTGANYTGVIVLVFLRITSKRGTNVRKKGVAMFDDLTPPGDWHLDPIKRGVPGIPDSGLDDGLLSWQTDALCAETDPEAFFPEKGGSTREAKRICAGCEVRSQCLEYALANDERFGIWGGLSERERRKLRKA